MNKLKKQKPIMNKFKLALLATVIGSTFATYANAACPIDGVTPLTIGPVNPQNGFPQWIQDSNGASVELCLDPGTCFIDPVLPDNPFSQQIGFGGEGFFWSATGIINNPISGLSAVLVQAAEAAFLVGPPVDGQQFPFTRLRIRVDVPATGKYTVTYPYGKKDFTVTSIGAGNEINVSVDLPMTPGSQYTGSIGPFLTSTSAPTGYFGDNAAPAPTTVTGSPCGTNFFRIEGVSIETGAPLNLDGSGGNVVQTDLFAVTGKLFSGTLNTPLSVLRSTYSRATSGQVDVFASAPAGAAVSVSGAANLPTGESPLTGNGQGQYAAHIALSNAGVLPPTINITAQSGANAATTLIQPLVDQITITTAEFDQGSSTLTVNASSSDQSATAPTLTVENFGVMANGALSQVIGFGPASVTVTSSVGGSATLPVSFVNSGVTPPPNTAPVAVNDTATVTAGVGGVVDVLANDSDADNDPLSIVSTSQGANGTVTTDGATATYTPVSGFTGTDQFTYIVQDPNGAQATATATITVNPASPTESLATTLVECRTGKQEWRISGTSSAPAGTEITAYAGATVLGGTEIPRKGTVDALGNWTIRDRNSSVSCSTPVSLTSSTGGLKENIPVNVRN